MQTNDIGVFFGSMTMIYGNLWSHGHSEIGTWRKVMTANKVTAKDLKIAAVSCLKAYPDHPPTMGQVLALVRGYLPMPTQPRIEKSPFSNVMAQANRILFSLLVKTGGVKKETLKVLLETKNTLALAAEMDGQDPVEFAAELDTLLRGLIEGHERE